MSDIEKANDIANESPAAAKIPKKTADSGKFGKRRKRASQKKQAFMYLGPNLPGGILFTGSIYKELPEHLKGVFEKAPEIKKLFVEIKGVPAYKAELERQGSEPNRLRQSVASLISEGALNNVL